MFVIAAIVIAVVCCTGGYLAGRMTASQPDDTRSVNTISVLVAKDHILVGTVLSEPEALLEPRTFLRESVPPDAIQDPAKLRGKTLERTIYKNTPITNYDVERYSDVLRFMTIRISVETAMCGFILPGSRVDLIQATPVPEDPRKSVTKVVVESAILLAVHTGKQVPGAYVTIAVTRDEAQQITEAKQRGTLSLALRRPKE
jgi:Flp pilus assembly protein CpaB